MSGKPEDTRPEVFTFPASFVRTTLAAAVLFLGVGLLGLALPLALDLRSLQAWAIALGALALGLGFAAFAFRVWQRRHERVEVHDAGLTWVRGRDRAITRPWREIAAVRERFWLQRLEVHPPGGARVIHLEYQLGDFDRLRGLILEHAPHLREQHARLREFRRHPMVRWGLLAPGAVVAGLVWFVIPRTELVALLIFGTFAAIALGVSLTQLRTVRIGPREVTLAYPLRERAVPYDAIAGVVLKTVDEGGHAVPTVVLSLRDGGPIRLAMFREGAIALYDALRAAWEATRAVPA